MAQANHIPDKNTIYKNVSGQQIPPIFTSALFALNHSTKFVEKLCQILPFNSNEDFI